MLYHVPDLHRGLENLRRVLRAGGTLVAVTNGERHLADLFADAGGYGRTMQFSGENGEQALRHHFDEVSRIDLATRAVFPDHTAARRYLATIDADLANGLPEFSGARTYLGQVSVFTAR